MPHHPALPAGIEIRLASRADADILVGADVFDHPARPDWTAGFLAREGHHMVLALADDEVVGFVSGVEIAHPDKGVEMLLYELGVLETHRRRGIGRALIDTLAAMAVDAGMRGMWVPIEDGDRIAEAVYRSAGAGDTEPAGILSWDFSSSDSG